MEKIKFNKIHFVRHYGTVSFAILIFVIFSVVTDNFLSVNNILMLLRQMSMLTICALGFTFVMAAGGFDMSLGNSCGLVNILFGIVIISTNSLPLSLLTALLVGLTIGLINGTLVAVFKLPDFIATYAVGCVAYGLKMLISKGSPMTLPEGTNPAALFIGQGKVGSIPFPAILMFVILAIVVFILKKCRLGRRIYAIGGNQIASRFAGINVKKYRMITFLISGCFISISSVVLTTRLGSAQPLAGEEFMLDTIASAYLSTTMFGEGEPTGLGTFIGAFIITMVTNGLTMLNMPYYFQYITKGLVVIMAVLFSVYTRDKNKSA